MLDDFTCQREGEGSSSVVNGLTFSRQLGGGCNWGGVEVEGAVQKSMG